MWRKRIYTSVYNYCKTEHKNTTWAVKNGKIKHAGSILVFTANPSVSAFMSLLSRHCFMAVMDSGDREGETSSGGHYFFSFRNPCFISPQTLSLPRPISLSHCAIYLFYMNSPSYIILYQFPLISAHCLCPLSYSHSFPRPTFHLFLWGVFLSDID